VERLVVENRDRLLRFGMDLVPWLCRMGCVERLVIDAARRRSLEIQAGAKGEAGRHADREVRHLQFDLKRSLLPPCPRVAAIARLDGIHNKPWRHTAQAARLATRPASCSAIASRIRPSRGPARTAGAQGVGEVVA
jgi:hypothetical protein